EHLTDFEPFKTESFVSKLLGRGDLQGLIEVMETFNKTVDMASLEKDLKKGKFTIRNMQEQFSALMNIGPLDQFLSMIPGLKPEMFGLVKGLNQNSKEEGLSTVIRSWMTVVDSMSSKELDHPEPAQLFKKEKSRVVRIARGSGRSFTETSETIKKMSQMQNTFKKLGPVLSQFKGGAIHSGGTNTMPDSGQMARMNSELMKMMNPQMLKQMGGQTGLSEMMKNLSKIDKRSLSGMKF
ncbi:MAG: Signal recognition particle, partial [Paramarteilia canceri]